MTLLEDYFLYSQRPSHRGRYIAIEWKTELCSERIKQEPGRGHFNRVDKLYAAASEARQNVGNHANEIGTDAD